MRGDIMDKKLNKQEATYVMNQIFRLYLTPDIYEKFIFNMTHDS
jgi:ATP synthase F1 complex assembly factor 1